MEDFLDIVISGLLFLFFVVCLLGGGYLLVGIIATDMSTPTKTFNYCGDGDGIIFTHQEVSILFHNDFYDDDFTFMSDKEYNEYCGGK